MTHEGWDKSQLKELQINTKQLNIEVSMNKYKTAIN